ncbi:c-type cytochrome [Arenibacter algicola]|uniref:c-type cytochrome n=1 Tax=Arenibacter algicola TaxID=616991 RepID=UPI0004DFAD6A|nr:cytochrome c [Arenibacter algicola]|tara:strand:- start:2122 stop:2973 length:852 start_codon:yes stop_codon:yes gene_type:complete
MGRNTSTPLLLISFLFLSLLSEAQDGEAIFKSTCAACHTTTSKRLVGPGLANIQDRVTIEWFTKFVRSSQTLINSGDAEAVRIFEEYNKVVMPDQGLSDAEINAVFDFIKIKSPAISEVTAQETVEEEVIPFEPTESDIAMGQDLFSGEQRFENGGPSCIYCHNLATDRIIPGGLLAKDLTTVFSRMGGDAGLTAILNAPPFPAMTEAYKNKSMTRAEIFAVTAFLNQVEKESGTESATAISPLLVYGFIAFLIWVGVVLLVWLHRKKYAVNKRIFERQLKSY